MDDNKSLPILENKEHPVMDDKKFLLVLEE